MSRIYEKEIKVIGKEYNCIDVYIYYDREYKCYEPIGVYTMHVNPVYIERTPAGLCSTTYGLFSGYSLEIHSCNKRTKKQDNIAIEKAHNRFDYMKLVNLLCEKYDLTIIE